MVDNVLPYLRRSWVLMKPASLGMWWQLLQVVLKLSGPPFLSGTRKESSSEPHPEDPVYFIHGKVTQYGDLLTYSLLQILKLVHTQPLVINQNYDLCFLGFWLLWLISREEGVGCDPSGNCSQIPFHTAVSVQENSLMSIVSSAFLVWWQISRSLHTKNQNRILWIPFDISK